MPGIAALPANGGAPLGTQSPGHIRAQGSDKFLPLFAH